MRTLNYFKQNYVLLIAIVLFVIASNINHNLIKPKIILSKQDETWNLNDEMIQRFNLGFKRLESSFLWISTILESDVEHYQKRDTNSWMFLRFNTISKLEPKFYENYSFGGPYLSIVKDDLVGASIIYDKGLKQFPDDFRLLKDAGFHYYFEVGNYDRAFEIYSKLAHYKKVNPTIVANLARLETSRGNLSSAFDLLSEQLQSIEDQDSPLALKIKSHLYAIKAEIDLNCLNQNQEKCSKKDFYQDDYLKRNDHYYAAHEWVPFRMKQRKK